MLSEVYWFVFFPWKNYMPRRIFTAENSDPNRAQLISTVLFAYVFFVTSSCIKPMKLLLLFALIAIQYFAIGYAAEGDTTETLLPSILLEATINSDQEGIQKAVDDGESIDVQNTNGWSAAMFCVYNGDPASLQLLIDLGIDLNAPNENQITPLMMASSQVIIRQTNI